MDELQELKQKVTELISSPSGIHDELLQEVNAMLLTQYKKISSLSRSESKRIYMWTVVMKINSFTAQTETLPTVSASVIDLVNCMFIPAMAA